MNGNNRTRWLRLVGAAAICAGGLLAARWWMQSANGGPAGAARVAPDEGTQPGAVVASARHISRPARDRGPMLLYTNWRSFTTKDGLPSNEAKSIRVDGGRVWVGTDKGLACYENGVWKKWGKKDGLPQETILALDVSPTSGDLWIGTGGGLSHFAGGRFENFTQMNSGLVNDLVYGISCLGDEVWVATAAGVSRYNTKTHDWRIYDHNNTIMFEPWCYAVSAKDDMVYVGVWGGGLVEYSLKTGYWKDYHDPDGELEFTLFKDAGILHEVIPAVSYDSGMVWAGSYFGLSTYNGRHWKNYLKADSGLISDFINFVRGRGREGWICTDLGLSSFDGSVWVNYHTVGSRGEMVVKRGTQVIDKRPLPQALAHNYLFGIDFQGDDVWVATGHGVSWGRPGPQRLTVARYEGAQKAAALSGGVPR